MYTGSMKTLPPASRYGFDSPATYRIGVQGRIPPRWCDRLEGMTITERSSEAEPPVTTLFGELSDQAALAGVLNTLYESASAGAFGGALVRRMTLLERRDPNDLRTHRLHRTGVPRQSVQG